MFKAFALLGERNCTYRPFGLYFSYTGVCRTLKSMNSAS